MEETALRSEKAPNNAHQDSRHFNILPDESLHFNKCRSTQELGSRKKHHCLKYPAQSNPQPGTFFVDLIMMWSDANAADLQDNSTLNTSSQWPYLTIKNTQQEGISCYLPGQMRRNIKTKNMLSASSFTHIRCLYLLCSLMLTGLAFFYC